MCKKGKDWEVTQIIGVEYRITKQLFLFQPVERVLRSSTLGQWTKEESNERAPRKNEKKKQAGAETREKGLASSSGKVRDKDVKVV